MNKIIITAAIFLLANTTFAQEIKIGTQTWSTKNLDVSTFRNGVTIKEAKTEADLENFGKLGIAAWCYYDNDQSNGKKYGKLYNYAAVRSSNGLAPKGWHIPSDAEWTILSDYLGGEKVAGEKMKSVDGWNDHNGKNGNGNNSSGFNGLPAGYRDDTGPYFYMGVTTRWWSSTETESNYAWYRSLNYSDNALTRNDFNQQHCFSVRCVKD